MKALIKRFTEKNSNLEIILISLIAASISVKINFLQPNTQFIVTALITTLTVVTALKLSKNFKKIKETQIFILISILVNTTTLISSLAALMIATILIAVFKPLKNNSLFLKAFSAHLLDAVTTLAVLDTLNEANVFMKQLMDLIGGFPALVLTKLFLVGLPLIYVKKEFERFQAIFFAKTVMIIGFSMAMRNMILFFIA